MTTPGDAAGADVDASRPLPKIRRLDENVINRIAAGEIIQRPANAIKELIENCLDASSTSINIIIKDGGLKILQIQDNGHGISLEDLPIVCERFTTSKLRQFEDLEKIETFGFRGEALASISHVAHVTITSRTRGSACAYRGCYADGKLVSPKPGASVDPKPVAGNVGTTITIEDLFFNMDVRRKAIKNSSEEYNRIVDIVQKYAIHNSGVSFTCKKHGSNAGDVHTATGATVIDNIRYVYGVQLAKELLDFKHENEVLEFSAAGYISNANYHQKKMIFLLFINHRLVDSNSIKRALETMYAKYLPKGQHPFVYVSLMVKPQNVDVNVHPTKREVHLLREDKITEILNEALEDRLASANASRTYYTQTLLPGASVAKTTADELAEVRKSASKVPEHKMVRTDAKTRTLDAFITTVTTPNAKSRITQKATTSSTTAPSATAMVPKAHVATAKQVNSGMRKRPRDDDDLFEDEGNAPVRIDRSDDEMEFAAVPQSSNPAPATGKRQYTDVRLISVLELRNEVKRTIHQGLTELFRHHTFVGCIDEGRALFQYQTGLYMVNYQEASCELFYQLILRVFSNFGFIRLATPLRIFDLVMVGLDEEEKIGQVLDEHGVSKVDVAKRIVKTLVDRRVMLLEYFSFKVSEEGELEALPALLKGYVPNFDKLPLFFVRCQSEVTWETEKECFETLSRELSLLYAVEPPAGLFTRRRSSARDHSNDSNVMEIDGKAGSNGKDDEDEARKQYMWTVEHVIFPAFRTFFQVPNSFVDNGAIVKLATLSDLYKVFERC
ncbi:hypothetical protein SeLEV6574_g06939 [Synchytrium endobioticum]|uniref:DNA mismatch repair protein S5 domain-containing protein n=1 Tax=Synchytrium endobioticum TaxID=286115 RepID=A0A507CJE8_9FUNG|nr:hypothetical protein SeLEV6574_g06939 [Synchytrium endobioticum]